MQFFEFTCFFNPRVGIFNCFVDEHKNKKERSFLRRSATTTTGNKLSKWMIAKSSQSHASRDRLSQQQRGLRTLLSTKHHASAARRWHGRTRSRLHPALHAPSALRKRSPSRRCRRRHVLATLSFGQEPFHPLEHSSGCHALQLRKQHRCHLHWCSVTEPGLAVQPMKGGHYVFDPAL